jgi:hypothetical protein
MLHFNRQGDRKEFVDKVGLAVEEYHVDDAPALSRALDNVNQETFRANKELSDQLQQIANRLEYLNTVLSEKYMRNKKNGAYSDNDDESGTSAPKRRSTPRTKRGGSKK